MTEGQFERAVKTLEVAFSFTIGLFFLYFIAVLWLPSIGSEKMHTNSLQYDCNKIQPNLNLTTLYVGISLIE